MTAAEARVEEIRATNQSQFDQGVIVPEDEDIRFLLGQLDRAIALDRHPYPTVTAYEKLCSAFTAAIAREEKYLEALKACRSFLEDPEGFAGVVISGTVWIRETMTLLDLVEDALAEVAQFEEPPE